MCVCVCYYSACVLARGHCYLLFYFLFGLEKVFSGRPRASSMRLPMSFFKSKGIHSFSGAPVPFLTSSVSSSAFLREHLVEWCLVPFALIPGFGMAWELITCLVRRVVGKFAIFWRDLSCRMMTSLSIGKRLSLLLRIFSIEMW